MHSEYFRLYKNKRDDNKWAEIINTLKSLDIFINFISCHGSMWEVFQFNKLIVNKKNFKD